MKSNGFINALVRNFFPNKCCACGEPTELKYLCQKCGNIERITVKVCDKCGLTISECDCKNNAFNFDMVIAPFYNTGIAQNAVYRMKFMGLSDSFDFVAQEITARIKEKCCNMDFDAVCYVPMHPAKRLKRGYNQSYELAKRISKSLNLPISTGLLKCINKNETQHKLSRNERFNNVRGKYKCTKNIEGMKILLVDDIRTSGATLNECARILKLSGAVSVVCAVAAVTQNYIEKAYKN